ncbi:MAG: glucose-1-phosphate cytidylyltransferase, partial [Bryobacteraceae bacterium]
MKTVILAGGLGTRLSEETSLRPKPMVEIGGKPILWHIMNMYAASGFCEFIVALGYKSDAIKDYFLNFRATNNDFTVDLKTGAVTVHDGRQPDWRVHLIDTGVHTETGGRLSRLRKRLKDEPFMLTYGDGVADIDIRKLAAFHRAHGKLATVSAVRPPSRFGGIRCEGDSVVEFAEKSQTGEGWINGGFFVLEPGALDYVGGDDMVWEREPLETLARDGELMVYRHEGFWQPMDTLREKKLLDNLWES